MVLTPTTPNTPPDASTPQLVGRYLLLQGSTPVYLDSAGRQWLDRLWAIDAREHLAHIRHFSIACPFVSLDESRAPTVAVADDPMLNRITFIELPWIASRGRALLRLPRMWATLWRAIRAHDIVHMGIAGWPYPLGWLGWPIARLQGKVTIVNVESAPWRTDEASPARWKRVQSRVYELLGRGIVRHSDLRFFTTEQYRQSLGNPDAARNHVIEATWIPEDQVLTAQALEAQLDRRAREPGEPLRIGFFGRITQDKGLAVLTGAMRGIGAGVNVSIDVYGDGPDLAALREELAADASLVRIRLCGTLTYGAEFFERLRDYDYLIVPSLGDEQPRIVYDAYSQGVPVLASDTTGLRQCVRDGETGLFFARGDTSALRTLLARVDSEAGRAARPALARRCVAVARSMTHAAMHEKRARVIVQWLAA